MRVTRERVKSRLIYSWQVFVSLSARSSSERARNRARLAQNVRDARLLYFTRLSVLFVIGFPGKRKLLFIALLAGRLADSTLPHSCTMKLQLTLILAFVVLAVALPIDGKYRCIPIFYEI